MAGLRKRKSLQSVAGMLGSNARSAAVRRDVHAVWARSRSYTYRVVMCLAPDCGQAWRKVRTASTRRLLSADSGRPSFMKTVRTCDSTVLGEMTRRLQIAWFE